MGIAGLALWWIPFGGAALPVLALCLGAVGLGQARRTGSSRGLGVAAVVLGTVGLVLAVAATTLFLIIWPKISPCIGSGLSSAEANQCLRDNFNLPGPTTDNPSQGPLLGLRAVDGR